jgi:hypothetical protein
MRDGLLTVATKQPLEERLPGYEQVSGEGAPRATWDIDQAMIGVTSTAYMRLREPPPLWASVCRYGRVLRTKFVPSGTRIVNFTISEAELASPTSTVRIRVVDAVDGQPVGGARVGLFPRGRHGLGKEISSTGIAEYTRISRGKKSLSIVASGYEWVSEEIEVEGSELIDLTYRLWPARSVVGRLIDERGAPVKACIIAIPIGRDAPNEGSTLFWTSDSNGFFKLHPLGARPYSVRLEDEDWVSRPMTIDLREVVPDNLVIECSAGVLVGIRFESCPSLLLATIRDQNGIVTGKQVVRAMRAGPWRLLPAVYDLEVEQSDGKRWTKPLLVAANTTEIVIRP